MQNGVTHSTKPCDEWIQEVFESREEKPFAPERSQKVAVQERSKVIRLNLRVQIAVRKCQTPS
jgi:hypothetical protein